MEICFGDIAILNIHLLPIWLIFIQLEPKLNIINILE